MTGLGYAYLVVDVNAQSSIKEMKQKILYQFSQPTVISSDQGTYFTMYNVDGFSDTLSQNMASWHIEYFMLKEFEEMAKAGRSL